MNTRRTSRRAWSTVRRQLAEGTTATVPKTKFPHPIDAGAHRTSTWPEGQIADFSIPGSTSQAPIVVREYDDRFEAFLDGVRLTKTVVDAAEANPTAATYLGGALLGGAVGASVSNRREGTLLGAGLGLLFAAMLDASLNDGKRRR
jgi:hypothetical protein